MDAIEQAYQEWDAAHPEVRWELEQLCREWIRAGRSRWSIDGVFEVVRWQRHLHGIRDAAGFKLNNNYRALYARDLLLTHPEWGGLFELRTRVSERGN